VLSFTYSAETIAEYGSSTRYPQLTHCHHRRRQVLSHSVPSTHQKLISPLGMGGLSCALALAKKGFKDIQVYENAPGLGFVGAGIQLAPNLVRILSRFGCWDSIEKEATDVLETSIRGIPTSTCYFLFPLTPRLATFPRCFQPSSPRVPN
jgi:hypothetical protein